MINNNDFAKRLKIVLDYYQLSAAAFAEKIKVQRSSISHLLSGRNKPSLDFVLKVLKEFEEVELYWLLNGKGSFPKTTTIAENQKSETPTLFSQNTTQTENKPNSKEISSNQKIVTQLQNSNTKKNIERIVIFYLDGTFKQYLNQD